MAVDKLMNPIDDIPDEGSIEVEIDNDQAPEEALPPPPVASHRDNLVEFLEEGDVQKIGSDLVAAFAADENSRADWLRTYSEGLNYLGFSLDDRDKPFKGASGVFHPVLAEAVVRFQSNAITEMFPASGPVLTRLMGKETNEKVAQAKRIKEELNYQLTENMAEYRSDQEKLLFRLPLAGSVFKKVYFDKIKGRPCSHMISAEDFVVNNSVTDMETAERVCQVMRLSKNAIRKKMRSGLYATVDLGDAEEYTPEALEKENELKGMSDPENSKDHRHTLLEFHVNINLPAPFDDPNEIADPYIITVEKSSGKVLSIYRNWAEGDPERIKENYFIHYEYMPGLGFYAFGLIHLMGSIAKSATSILRQLIDAGTFKNLPGGLKTRGLRAKGDDEPIQPGEWRDIDVPTGGKLADSLFPLPYGEPSAVLANLLVGLVEEGRRIGSIADAEIGNVSENAPVGTTLAIIERSLKVMSAVHARLHAAMRRELKLIAKVISEYMPPQYDWDEEGEFDRTKDFDGRVDVLPVSDPNAATQAQKIVQLQAVMQMAQQNPELYNLKELHRIGLQAIGLKDDERILPLDQDPPRMDPVQENMALMTSQPVKVYPEQDHSAHLQVHVAAMMDPKIMEMVGQSPNAQKLMGQMEAHIAEHMALQYRAEIEEQIGTELPPIGEELPPEVEARLSRLVAEAALRLREEHKREMQQKEAEEVAADPVFQLREREVALKEREAFHKMNLDNKEMIADLAKTAAKEAMDVYRIQSEERRAAAKIGADLVTFGAQLESEERREGIELGRDVAKDIRSDMREAQRALQESEDKAEDRRIQLEIAEKNAKAKPSGNSK